MYNFTDTTEITKFKKLPMSQTQSKKGKGETIKEKEKVLIEKDKNKDINIDKEEKKVTQLKRGIPEEFGKEVSIHQAKRGKCEMIKDTEKDKENGDNSAGLKSEADSYSNIIINADNIFGKTIIVTAENWTSKEKILIHRLFSVKFKEKEDGDGDGGGAEAEDCTPSNNDGDGGGDEAEDCTPSDNDGDGGGGDHNDGDGPGDGGADHGNDEFDLKYTNIGYFNWRIWGR